MKNFISQYIRSLAASIVGIETDEEEDNKEFKVENPTKEIEVKHIRTDNEITERKYQLPPKQKPKRRDHTLSEWDYKDKRKDYMKDYRNEGKDIETGNKYVKKIKGDNDG